MIENLFSIGICKFKTDEIDNNAIIDYCKNFNFKRDKEIGFDNEVLNNLKSKFLEAGQVYLQNILGSNQIQPIKINRIWGNLNVDEAITIPHTHKTSLMSAVYYCTPGTLVFTNPARTELVHINEERIMNYNEYNSDYKSYQLEPGNILVFNSQTYHYALPSKEFRLSIACDMLSPVQSNDR